jgi:hypothetical protein
MKPGTVWRRLALALSRALRALTHHHSLHAPEHIGSYAGSLLEKRDWDHS